MSIARNLNCAHVKDPISICHERVGLTAGDNGNTKTLYTDIFKKLSSAYYDCSLSLGKASRISRALHWDKTEMECVKKKPEPVVTAHTVTNGWEWGEGSWGGWGEGQATKKSAQSLTRRDRKTCPSPYPPGDRTQGLRI